MVSAASEKATNVKTKTNKREKRSHLWVKFDVGTKDYTKTSKEVLCILYKAKNVKVPINGRLDAMATHLAKRCAHVPKEVKVQAVQGDAGIRKHRRRDASGGGGGGHINSLGPMDAHLPRPFSPPKTREFQTDLLGVHLFSVAAPNFTDSPVLRYFLLKWVLGLKTLPTRQTLSGAVLDRLVADCVAAATIIYLKGCYIAMYMVGWKSRELRKLMGILCSNVGSADGRVAADFRRTTDITLVFE